MRKWGATMKRLRPKEHTANVTERDEVCWSTLSTLQIVTRPMPDDIDDICGDGTLCCYVRH